MMSDDTLDDAELQAIRTLQCLWPRLSPSEIKSDDFQQFLAWVVARVKTLENYRSPDNTCISFDEWACILERVRSDKCSSKLVVIQQVRHSLLLHGRDHVSNDTISKVLDLAASLWLNSDVRSSTLYPSSGRGISWPDDVCLSALIGTHFKAAKKQAEKGIDSTRLNLGLTMDNLVSNYNYSIVWTHNLDEHLTIDWGHKTIVVFEHKVSLWNHLRFGDRSILPRELLEEALDTINLLFPFDDAPTESLLRRHKIDFYGLGFCNRPRVLELSKFNVWRNRIAELNRVLDEPPAGIHQLGLDRDRRNLLQFATFWMATAVAMLTIITFVIGVYSAVYAKKQYDLGLLQYRLSLAQACTAPDAKIQLAEFCS